MDEKDPSSTTYFVESIRQGMPYITTVFLACWGGAVQHIQKLRTGKRFVLKEFFFDLFTSAFAGLLTHFACESAGIGGSQAAMLIAVSGHMGTKAIASLETLHQKIFPNEESKKDGE